MLGFISAVSLVLIIIHGGRYGALYLAMGIVWNWVDWLLYWRPQMNEASRPISEALRENFPIQRSQDTHVMVKALKRFLMLRTSSYKFWFLPLWLGSFGMHLRILQRVFMPSAAEDFRRSSIKVSIEAMLNDPSLPNYLNRVAARGYVNRPWE